VSSGASGIAAPPVGLADAPAGSARPATRTANVILRAMDSDKDGTSIVRSAYEVS
jgi:hypothetical protein